MKDLTNVKGNLASIREVALILRTDDTIELPSMAKTLEDRCDDIELELFPTEGSIDFEDLRQLVFDID